MQLVVDAWWAIIVASHFVSRWSDGAATALFVSGAAFAIYWITMRVGLRAAGLGTREAAAMLQLWRALARRAGVAPARFVEVAAVTDARRRRVPWRS